MAGLLLPSDGGRILSRWLLLLAAAGGLHAQGPSDCEEWAKVKGWTGTVTLIGKGSGTDPTYPATTGVWKHTMDQTVVAKFDLRSSPYGGCDRESPWLGWIGDYSDTVSLRYEQHYTPAILNKDCPLPWIQVTTFNGSSKLWTAPNDNLLYFDFKKRKYYTQGQNGARTAETATERTTDSCGRVEQKEVAFNVGPIHICDWPECEGTSVPWYPLPAPGQPVAGTHRFKSKYRVSNVEMDWEATWNFEPKFEELEVVVEPRPLPDDSEEQAANYASWLPRGALDEATPGNGITIYANLQQPDGKDPSVKARKFFFELTDASRQPGVAMNFPLQAAQPGAADLQFDGGGTTGLIVTGADSQKAETKDGEYTEAEAAIAAFDYGAWGAVKVTAELRDGRKIVGYLKGDRSQKEVRLPKRPPGVYVADYWKSKHGVGLPDDDDTEKEPDGLRGCDGDGLTLYEEYRGFIENGKHFRANPKKKDLLVLNLGGDALAMGIWAFAEATGLEVHQDFTQAEIDKDRRLINENHADPAPHRAEQHALAVAVCGTAPGQVQRRMGAAMGITYIIEQFDGHRGRPRISNGVCIADAGYLTNYQFGSLDKVQPGKLAPVDQFSLTEKTVMHELLHSVGVEHHGPEIDTGQGFHLLFPIDPRNTTGKPAFFDVPQFEGSRPIRLLKLLDESTGEDLAASAYPAAVRFKIGNRHLIGARWGYQDEQALDIAATFFYLTVGEEGGPHSGHERCVMRYIFARAYPKKGVPDTFYNAPAGSESAAGLDVCEARTGTGVNAPARKPQPRYFDASPGHGECKKWICVNDDLRIPLVKNDAGSPEAK